MGRERVNGGGEMSSSQSQPQIQPQTTLSIAEIRQLITLMNNGDIDEIAIEQEGDGLKLALRKAPPLLTLETDGDGDMYDSGETLAIVEEAASRGAHEIGAPLVGVFRASMKPGDKPLVRVGDVVRQGQVVAAIEALNVVNEVEASTAGRVSDILAHDGQPVEYGQPLLVIEP